MSLNFYMYKDYSTSFGNLKYVLIFLTYIL